MIRARSNRVNSGIPIVTFFDSGFLVTFFDSGFLVTFLGFAAVFSLDLLDNKSQIPKAIMMVQISITQGNNFVDNFNTIWPSILSMDSFSKKILKISILGKTEFEGEVYRHMAPRSFTSLVQKLPIEGRIAHYQDVFVYLLTGIPVGLEKGRLNFREGDIAMLPSNGAFCIFLKNYQLSQPMTGLGRILNGKKILSELRQGDTMKVSPS